MRDAELATASLTVELKLGENAIPDLAPIEEDVDRLRAELDQLDAFDRALALAPGSTVSRADARQRNQAFARRLETYGRGRAAQRYRRPL